jgi:tetratricopeptide (TPR) repeat protein
LKGQNEDTERPRNDDFMMLVIDVSQQLVSSSNICLKIPKVGAPHQHRSPLHLHTNQAEMENEPENVCHKLGCKKYGAKLCGSCGVACYCSADCQKDDWNTIHMIWCKNKLPHLAIPIFEIDKVLVKVHQHVDRLYEDSKLTAGIAILERLLSFLELQYGTRVPGRTYRVRKNSDRVDDLPLIKLRFKLSEFYTGVANFDKSLLHSIACRQLLESRTLGCDDKVLRYLCQTEINLCSIYFEKGQLTKAQHHGEEAVTFARKLKGEGHIKCLSDALRGLGDTYGMIGRYSEALELTKESYFLISENFGPERPDAQNLSSQIIEYLVFTGDYSTAHEYARLSYDVLVDPRNGVHPEHYTVGIAMSQLASLWAGMPSVANESEEKGVEAEYFARRACVIMLKRYGRDLLGMSKFFKGLGDVLFKKWSFCAETRIFIEQIEQDYRLVSDQNTSSQRNRLHKIYIGIMQDPYTKIEDIECEN